MIKIAEFLLGLIRAFSRVAIIPLIWILMPVKLFAWRTSVRCLKQFILEITGFIDFVSVFALVQNHAMLAHYRVYRGNFIFGKSLMVVDHEKAEKEIALPTLRGNRFMGVDIVSNDPAVFLTNAGPINSSQPVRGQTRAHIEETIMTDREREICDRIGPALRERGFTLVGIDVIGGLMTEINVTSPTGIREVKKFGGADIAALFWDAVEAKR